MGKSDYSRLDGRKQHGCCYRCCRSICCCFFGCAKCICGLIVWILILAVVIGLIYLGMAIACWVWVSDTTWSFPNDFVSGIAVDTEIDEYSNHISVWQIPMHIDPEWASKGMALDLVGVDLQFGQEWMDKTPECEVLDSYSELDNSVRVTEDEVFPITLTYTMKWSCPEGVQPHFRIKEVPQPYAVNVDFWDVFPAGPNRMLYYLEGIMREPLGREIPLLL